MRNRQRRASHEQANREYAFAGGHYPESAMKKDASQSPLETAKQLVYTAAKNRMRVALVMKDGRALTVQPQRLCGDAFVTDAGVEHRFSDMLSVNVAVHLVAPISSGSMTIAR